MRQELASQKQLVAGLYRAVALKNDGAAQLRAALEQQLREVRGPLVQAGPELVQRPESPAPRGSQQADMA